MMAGISDIAERVLEKIRQFVRESLPENTRMDTDAVINEMCDAGFATPASFATDGFARWVSQMRIDCLRTPEQSRIAFSLMVVLDSVLAHAADTFLSQEIAAAAHDGRPRCDVCKIGEMVRMSQCKTPDGPSCCRCQRCGLEGPHCRTCARNSPLEFVFERRE